MKYIYEIKCRAVLQMQNKNFEKTFIKREKKIKKEN